MYKVWSDEEIKKLKEMSQNGYKDKEIATALNKSEDAVSSKRYRENIEQVKLNENLFNEWTEQNTWLLGLLTADGSFGKNRNSIVLYNTNKNLLKQFKNIIQTKNEINEHINKSRLGNKKVWRLRVENYKIASFLKSINGFGDKDHRNPFSNIPDKYKWSFVKGLYDGDGNFYKGSLSIAGREGLIKEVYYWICKQIDKNPNKIYQSTITNKTYYFQISHKDTEKVVDLIEKNTRGTYKSCKYNDMYQYFN